MRESKFQYHVIERLNTEFPGCYVLKTDPEYIQGFPDLLVLYNDTWAALEIKKDRTARHQPNQDNYIYDLNDMSYAAFLFPENEEEVFNDLQRTFRLRG